MTIGRVIDISSNNHPGGSPIDWPTVAKAGVSTVIIKATQGSTYTNPYYASDLAGARAAGLEVCAYHFAEFTDVKKEVDHFKSVAGELAQCLDIETSEDVAWSRTFLQSLGYPQDELLIYGSSSSLRSIYAQLPAMAWVAAYQSHSPGYGVLWQFTSNATVAGISGPVDQSVWQGSEIQYDTLFGVYDPTPPPPPPQPIPPVTEDDDMATGDIVVKETGDARHVFVSEVTDDVPPKVSVHHWNQSISGKPNYDWAYEKLGPES